MSAGYLYILSAGDRWKVGLSNDPDRRYRELKNAASPDLKQVEQYPTGDMVAAEKLAHDRLKQLGLHSAGEVFTGRLEAVKNVVMSAAGLYAETGAPAVPAAPAVRVPIILWSYADLVAEYRAPRKKKTTKSRWDYLESVRREIEKRPEFDPVDVELRSPEQIAVDDAAAWEAERRGDHAVWRGPHDASRRRADEKAKLIARCEFE